MKKVFYVVDYQYEDIDGFKEQTGWKYIDMYSIENNDIKSISQLDIPNEDNSEESIIDYFNDNGLEEEEITLKQL